MRGATGRSRAALRQWGGADNPFLGRALHVETRSGQPLRLALLVGIVLLLVNFGFWRAWPLYSDNLFNGSAPSTDGSSAALLPSRLPDALGGNFIGYAALAAAATCACAALLMARVRVSTLLRREQLQGTLEQLQLLPIAAERWLWLAGAPGVAWAMLIGLLGLPLFALAVWTQQWSVWDVFGLFFVFLWLGHVAPAALVVSTASSSRNRTATAKPSAAAAIFSADDTSSTRLSEANAASSTAASSTAASSTAASSTAASSAAASSTAASSAAASGTVTVARTLRGVQSETMIASVLMTGAIQFIIWLVRTLIFTLGGGGKTLRLIGLPESVVGLLPALPLTWPLFLARLIVTPLPFFALSLPPVLLLLPWHIARRRRAYLALANQVDAPSSVVRRRREMRRSRLGRSVNWLGWAMVVGYGWHPLMTLGVPALLLYGTSPVVATSTTGLSTPAWARAALWTVILILAALGAWNGILDAFGPEQKRLREKTVASFKAANSAASNDQNSEATPRPEAAPREEVIESSTRLSGRLAPGQWRAALQAIGVHLGVGAAAYFVLCWLGGTTGTDAVWRERLVPTTSTVLAFLVAALGAAAMGAALPDEPWKLRMRWRKIAWLWFGGLLLVALAFHAYDQINTSAPSRNFEFEQAPYVVWSPLVSLLSLLRFSLSRPGAQWQSGPMVQVVVGVALIALSIPVSQLQLRASGADRPGLLRRLWRLLMRGLSAVLRGVWHVVVFLLKPLALFLIHNYKRPFAKLYATIERGVNFLVDWGESLGNPVLDVALHRPVKATTTAEIKREALRTAKTSRSATLRQSWIAQCALCLFFEIFLFVMLAFLSGSLLAPWSLASGWPTNWAWQAWGQGLCAIAVAISLLMVLLGTSSLGNALDRDRTNGTLIFLFLTPLSDAEILGGKLLFPLLNVLPFLATALPWLLLGTLVAFLGDDYAMPIVALLALLLVLSVLAFALCWQTRGAARATKTGTGASSAAGFVLLVECVFGALLFVAFSNGWLWLCLALMAASALHFALAHRGWNQALKALNRRRFSDEATRGTVSN